MFQFKYSYLVFIIIVIFLFLFDIFVLKDQISKKENFNEAFANQTVAKVAKIYSSGDNVVNNANIQSLNIADRFKVNSNDTDKLTIDTNNKNQFVINKNGDFNLINKENGKQIYSIKKTGQFRQNDISWTQYPDSTINAPALTLGPSVSVIDNNACQDQCAGNPYCTHSIYKNGMCQLIGPKLRDSSFGSLGLRQKDGGFKRFNGAVLFRNNESNDTGYSKSVINGGIDQCEALCSADSNCAFYHFWADEVCALARPTTEFGTTVSQKSFVS